MFTSEVSFSFRNEVLSGTVFLPGGAEPHPAVVMVHGSGGVDRYGAQGTLKPVMERFVMAGFAVLSYDKPGVGWSTGRWERQTFDDRAAETLTAVRFLAQRPDIDAARIGLWGISQGGWTVPITVASAAAEIAFAVLVSASALTPCEQSIHQIVRRLRGDGFSEVQVARAVELHERRTAALAAATPSSRILAEEPESSTRQPWYEYCRTSPEELDFVRPIWHFDVLPFVRRLSCPLLAIWGAEDVHMPAQRCAAAFAASLAEADHESFRIQVFPAADHRIRVSGEGNVASGLAPGYVESMVTWLAEVTHRRERTVHG